jgi:flavin-dependent dehydrogenase
MQEFDVIIIGAGPAGLTAARKLAEGKAKVLCIDKKQEIGVPKRCAEGLGLAWMNRLGLKPDKKWCLQEIHGAALYAPSMKSVEIDFKKVSGYVIERRIFEKELAKAAAKKGALIKAKCHANSFERKGSKVVVSCTEQGQEIQYSAPLIMACDGTESLTARRLGLDTKISLNDIDSGYQYEMTNIKFDNTKFINLFFGKNVAPRGYCLTPESEVFMSNSVKQISAVQEGEQAMTLDGWENVVATSEREYSGSVFDVVPKMFNKKVGLTAEHEVFVWNKENGFCWKKAKTLVKGERGLRGKGDYLVVPIPKGKEKNSLRVSDYYPGGIEKQGLIYPVGKNQFGSVFPYKHGIKRNLDMTKDLLYLMGFFVAEGNTNSSGIILSNTKKPLINRLERTGKKEFGFNGSIWVQRRDADDCYQLHFSSVILKKIFSELFGVGCKNKKIPPFFFNLDQKKKVSFLKGYFDGDGCVEKSPTDGYDVLSFATSSKHLANDLWMLLASIGIVAAVGKNTKKNSFKIRARGKQLEKLKTEFGKLRYGSKKPQTHGFRIVEDKICLGIRLLNKRLYSGKVHDIQTNGSFCVPFAVHNCWIFPKGKSLANVGIGITGQEEKTAKEYLDRFIQAHPGLRNGSIIEVNAGTIPVGGFLENMAADNLLVCGDAAHQVNPIHGGGIGIAMEAASIAAGVALKAVKAGDFSHGFLQQYNSQWYETRGNKLKKILKQRHMLEELDDDNFETLAKAVTGDDVMKIAEGDLVGSAKMVTKKLITHPKLAKVMLKYLK